MTYFETLDELGAYAETAGVTFEVVDPGIPLTEWDADTYGPAWKNQPSIRKVVGFIARHVASTPLHLYERSANDDRTRVRDGRIAALLAHPSRAPGQTAYRFWESLLIDGLLHDKWCAQIVEHEDGYELVRIPAHRVKFKSDWLGRITKVRITGENGVVTDNDPDGYILDVGYSERGANGTSPLRTLRDILDEQREAVAYRRSIWKNSARVPLVLERPATAGAMSDTAYARLKSSWGRFAKGGGEEGGTPILEDGTTAKELTSFRPRDTLDLEGRRLTDAEVAAAYYIAPELVGAREGTFANIKAFKEMLFGPNLGPYFDAFVQALNAILRAVLMPREGDSRDLYIEANIEAKMRGSFEEQIDYLTTAVGAPVMTRNEARPRLNLSQVDGGDELITPLNVLIGGQTSPQDGETAGRGGGSVDQIEPAAVAAGKTAEELQRLVTGATALIRAGFDPQDSLRAMGLDPILHLGLLPVTVRDDAEKSAADVIRVFEARQEQTVRSQKAAGVLDWWDRRRWDRELVADLSKSGMDISQAAAFARLVNDRAERKFLTEGTS